jgi:hypothetical protein
MKKVLYINGDSWLASSANRVVCNNHPLFKNFFVINQAVPGSGNMEIINNTRSALSELKLRGINPVVCVGLSEVGRNFKDEIKLVPKKENLTEYLESILIKQFEILQHDLVGYQSYLFTGWTHNPLKTKSIIDFIDQDFIVFDPVYTVRNKIYNLLDHLSFVSKISFVEAVEAKQKFESALLNNKYVNDTLHLDWGTSDLVFEKFFTHVLSTVNIGDDK